jgi:hypothetical protein
MQQLAAAGGFRFGAGLKFPFRKKPYEKQSRSFALIGFAPRRSQPGFRPSKGIAPPVQGSSAEQFEIWATAATCFRRKRRGPHRKAGLSQSHGGLIAR